MSRKVSWAVAVFLVTGNFALYIYEDGFGVMRPFWLLIGGVLLGMNIQRSFPEEP